MNDMFRLMRAIISCITLPEKEPVQFLRASDGPEWSFPIEVAGFVLCRFQANCTNKFVIAISLEARIAV